MSDCKVIFDNNNNRVSVQDKNGDRSKLFDQIKSNPQIGTFQAALPIYIQTLSSKVQSKGTGKQNTEFFEGKAKEASSQIPYSPVLNVDQTTPVAEAYRVFTAGGNFTGHISKMIAGFQEKQKQVAEAIVKGDFNSFLDIGTSEGGMIKTVASQKEGMVAVGVDPNLEMQKNFNLTPEVENAEFKLEAFQGSWVEADGTEIKEFQSEQKFDVVNEDFTFQFVNNDRATQVKGVKELMSEDGIFITSEKFHTANEAANEAKKYDHQRKYFSPDQLTEDKQTIVSGMADDMVNDVEYFNILKDNFKYVVEFWNAGNFKGYLASNNKAVLDKFKQDVGDLSSEFTDVSSLTAEEGLTAPKQPEPSLTYKVGDTQYPTYSEALKASSDGSIEGGIETDKGFTPLFTVSPNTTIASYEGMVNGLIKGGILSDQSYTDKNGKINLIPEGKSEGKKAINAEIVKAQMQKALGRRAVTLLENGDIRVNEDRNKQQIQIGDKFVTPAEIAVEFKELKKEFGTDTAVDIVVAQSFKEGHSNLGEKIEEIEFVPENVLQEKLAKLLKEMGVKTLSFQEYVKNFTTKNGIAPSASALSDLGNSIAAFNNGEITEEDLAEETAHFIVAATPQAEKENLLRNIHKTQEWLQYADTYREIYGNEDLVREEILGKVLANALQSQFQARGQNATEDSILSKIRDIFNAFFDKVRAYFKPEFQQQLDEYTQRVYDNLMKETLADRLETKNTRTDVLFSAQAAPPKATTLYLKSLELLDRLVTQQYELGKKYKGTADKIALSKAKEVLVAGEENLNQVEKINAISNIVRVSGSQTNILIKAVENKEATGFHFTQQENVVYQNLIKRTEPILIQLVGELNVEEKNEKILKEELQSLLSKIQELKSIVPKNNTIALDAIMQRVFEKCDMVDDNGNLTKEGEDYKKIIKASLEANQKDTDYLHAHLGSLLSARNPILNLAGDVVERTNLESLSNFQKPLKVMLNAFAAVGFNPLKLNTIVKKGYVINEKDKALVDKVDNEEKSAIFNKVLTKLGVTSIEATTPENVNAELKKIRNNNTEDGRLVRTGFNRDWNNNVKERRTTYFTEAYIKALEEHKIKTDSGSFSKEDIYDEALELDRQYRAETTQIRINAGENLTKEDQYRIQEVNRRRASDANPRDLYGKLIDGIEEVYDENLGKYIIALTSDVNSLPDVQKKHAKMVHGLNMLSLINQDFYKNNERPDGIPQKFIDALTALQTEEERKEFLQSNSYIGFTDDYWKQMSESSSVIDALREAGEDDLIEDIRRQQGIISAILKQNRVFNNPSETNFNEMRRVHQLDIKDAQADLDNLYKKARKALPEGERTEPISESIVNEAYSKEIADRKIKTQEEELNFISDHTTIEKRTSIDRARDLVRKLKTGDGRISKAMANYFTYEMSEQELDEALLTYAKSKLLPYFKKSEPIGFSEAMNSMPVLDFINRTDLVKITPSFSFYESNANINPEWTKNNELGREQYKKSYLDKVRNNEYYSYFDIDETTGDRKSAKNEKEWKAREILLDYQDQMIEYNNLTGVQDRYMMPQVRKNAVERFAGLTLAGVKNSIKDIYTFRPEEAELGENLEGQQGKKGGSLLTIPTYYNRPLEDQNELTDNVLYAYILYGQAASLHKSRRENIGDILTLEDTLLGMDFKDKESDATNSYKMLQAQIQSNFYGKKEMFNLEGRILGKDVNYGKLAKTMNNFFKFTNLAGLTVPITSLFQSQTQKTLETLTGEITNSSAAKVGNRYFLDYGSEAAKEVMGFSSNAFINVLLEGIGVYNMNERFENSQYNKGIRSTIDALNGQAWHKLSNYPTIPRMALSIMGDYRYVNGNILTLDQYKKANNTLSSSDLVREWEKNPIFIDDIIYATKDGVLDFNNPEFLKRVSSKTNKQGEELVKYLQNKKEQISQKSLSAIQRIDSQIPAHQRSIANLDARANFLLSHLNYLLVQIPLKFKERHFNISEMSYQEGNFRTTFNFLEKIIMNPKGINKIWKETMADEVARKNLKRTVVELAVANALAVACILLSGYVDKDDDPNYAEEWANYMLTRLSVEQISGTVGIPSSIANVAENPIMIYQKAKGLMKAGDLFDSTVGKTGDTKRYKFISNYVPYLRDYNRFRDPKLTQQTYSFFQEDKTQLFDSYAFLSNLVDEE